MTFILMNQNKFIHCKKWQNKMSHYCKIKAREQM